MQKLTILKFFVPIAIITSIFSGPVYNLLIFLNVRILETQWGIYYDTVLFANLMALSFILFTLIFIISIRYVDKILKEQIIILGMLLIGFCCIFASLIWGWEIIILVFLVSSISMSFLIPMMIKYTSNIVQKNYENKRYLLALPVSVLCWIIVSFILFNAFGVHWRFLFVITGIINIFASLVFVFI